MTDTLPALRADAIDAIAEQLLTTQSPQRPQVTPTFDIDIDGRTLSGRVGQTILEVCRDNGIEVPTLCYEPKLPGFGACRMCVVEVEGEDAPPISCSRDAAPDMVVQTQTPRLRQVRKTNLELIFSDHNAYCLPPCQNKCPSHIDIPGFLKANTEGSFTVPGYRDMWRSSSRSTWDGTITVSEYNHDAVGGGDTRRGMPASLGFTKFVDFGIHPSACVWGYDRSHRLQRRRRQRFCCVQRWPVGSEVG